MNQQGNLLPCFLSCVISDVAIFSPISLTHTVLTFTKIPFLSTKIPQWHHRLHPLGMGIASRPWEGVSYCFHWLVLHGSHRDGDPPGETPHGENLEITSSSEEKSPKKQTRSAVQNTEIKNDCKVFPVVSGKILSASSRFRNVMICVNYKVPPSNSHTLHLLGPAESCTFSLFLLVAQPSHASSAATQIGFGQRWMPEVPPAI